MNINKGIFNMRNKKELSTSDQSLSNVTVWIDNCGKLDSTHILIQGWAFHPDVNDINFSLSINLENEKLALEHQKKINFDVIRTTRLDVNKHFSFTDNNKKWGFAIVANWPYSFEPNSKTLCLNISNEFEIKNIKTSEFTQLSGETLFGHCITWRSEERLKLMSVLHNQMGNDVFNIQGFRFNDEVKLKQSINWNWDYILAVPGHGVFMSGWLLDAHKILAGIFIRTQDNSYSDNLIFNSKRYARPDVNQAFPGQVVGNYQAGLFAWVPMPHLIEHSSLEILFITKNGEFTVVKINQHNIYEDIELGSQQVLVNFNLETENYLDTMTNHIGPALSAMWQNRQKLLGKPNVEIHQFGPEIKSPKRSVIIPIYGRYDFLLHQVAQFIKDPDIKETEIIYVLDDPRLYSAFLPFCHDTSLLFSVPFKVIYAGRNLGYAGANNLGADYASAEQLILLNSDIIPSNIGWLSRIESVKKELPNVGVVAPKLVFDDGTIQHLGMSFSKANQFGGIWLNEHPCKGTPEWLADSQPIMESPAVTGACMFIDKSLYHEVGGLDETYVLGDFEDSDLCLKLRSLGYKHYVIGSEKLYHLERQSQDLFENRDWKFKITLYNAWQHTERWGCLIQELVV